MIAATRGSFRILKGRGKGDGRKKEMGPQNGRIRCNARGRHWGKCQYLLHAQLHGAGKGETSIAKGKVDKVE